MSGRSVFTVHGTRFELPSRYELARDRGEDSLGSETQGGAQGYGAFGAVCGVQDTATDEAVMVKKVQGIFSRPGADTARFVRELRLLTSLSHPCIVALVDAWVPTTREEGGVPPREVPLCDGDMLSDLYVVTRRYDATLLEVIRSKQLLEKRHVRVFASQLLSALRYLHELGVVHTRLCPANILCDMDCTIAVGELGNAEPWTAGAPLLRPDGEAFRRERDEIPQWPKKERSNWGGFDHDERSEVWYKAPEVLLRAPRIGPECDVWSAGLIVAELLNRRPLFPGASYVEQLRLITDCFGMRRPQSMIHATAIRAADLAEPKEDMVLPGPLSDPSAGSSLHFLSGDRECVDAAQSRCFLLSMAPKGKVPLRTLVPTADKFTADLLECMLQFAPARRRSAELLQQHPLFHADAAAHPDSLIVHRDRMRRAEPLGFVWEEMSKEGETAVVLRDVADGTPAERAGGARFVGCRAAWISPPTTRGAGDGGPTYQHKVQREEPIVPESIRRGGGGAPDGRLWLEENPAGDRDVRVTIHFGPRWVSPLDPDWAVLLHIAQMEKGAEKKLNEAVWECIRPFGPAA